MSTTNDTISVAIRADVAALVDGLKTSSAAVKQAAEDMKTGLGAAGAAADEHGARFESFTDVLREFKSEQTSNARVARFFAGELAEIIPGAEGAAGSLKSLIAIGLEGAGIGAGIELAAFALKQFTEHINEQHVRLAELRKMHFDTWIEVQNALRDVMRTFETPLSKTDETVRAQVDKIDEQMKRLKFTMDDALAHPTKWQSLKQQLGIDQFEEIRGKLAQLAQERAKLLDSPEAKVTAAAEQTRQIEEAGDKMRAEAVRTADELVRIEVEKQNKISAIRRDVPNSDPTKATQIALAIADAEERSNEIRRQRALAHSRAVIDIEGATFTEFERLALESATRQDAIRERYRQRLKSGTEEDQAEAEKQMNEELKAETQRFDALNQKRREAQALNHDQTLIADKKLWDERDAMTLTEGARLEELQTQLQTAGDTERYTSALETIRKRQGAEGDLIGQALRDHLVTAEKADQMMEQSAARAAKDSADAWLKSHKLVSESINTLTSGFGTAIKSMIDGSKDLGQAMIDLGKSMLNAVIDTLLKIGAQELASAIASIATAKAADISKTQGSIAVAVAGAAASQAFIPIIGPEMAIGAASSMEGFLEGITAPLLASAAGGFDIPSGVNPITQLHAQEMVLPADIAEPMRQWARGGGGMGGPQIHFHGPVIGTADFFSLPEVQRGYREARRNGGLE